MTLDAQIHRVNMLLFTIMVCVSLVRTHGSKRKRKRKRKKKTATAKPCNSITAVYLIMSSDASTIAPTVHG